MAKINKALDYNKLLQDQQKGKLLKKKLSFPLWAGIKYDGNYVVILVDRGQPTFYTSGGLTYTHTDKGGDIFNGIRDGAYFAERIAGLGKLGDRSRCNLKGSKTAQTSTGHTYKVHDYVTLEDYYDGQSGKAYSIRRDIVLRTFPDAYIAIEEMIDSIEELEVMLSRVVKQGYEGLMLKQCGWKWKDTKSRTVSICKYKKRPTADLLCIGTTEGEGKYVGMVGAVVLKDSSGRIVNVGSGLSDFDRSVATEYVGQVIEIEYEQIMDTYIQPTVVQLRPDKSEKDID